MNLNIAKKEVRSNEKLQFASFDLRGPANLRIFNRYSVRGVSERNRGLRSDPNNLIRIIPA